MGGRPAVVPLRVACGPQHGGVRVGKEPMEVIVITGLVIKKSRAGPEPLHPERGPAEAAKPLPEEPVLLGGAHPSVRGVGVLVQREEVPKDAEPLAAVVPVVGEGPEPRANAAERVACVTSSLINRGTISASGPRRGGGARRRGRGVAWSSTGKKAR